MYVPCVWPIKKNVLRSNSSLLLEPPKEKMLATLGARSFYAAAPCLWNSLPPELRDVNSISIFKRNFKTHFFVQVFFFSVLVFIKIVRF